MTLYGLSNTDIMSQMMINCSAYEIIMIVHELHLRGFEQLRLYSGMSPNGCNWRWYIYPKVLMKDNTFERQVGWIPFDWPSGSTGEAFPEKGRKRITADDFIKEYDSYVSLAKGEDKEYVKWFETIVNHAKNKNFPIAFSEYYNGEQWEFTSGEQLDYPPFSPVSI